MSDEDFQVLWNARVEALASVLGPPGEMVFHAMIPFCLGGSADVVPFPGHAGGIAYATSDLIGDAGQIRNELGEFELAVCHPSPDDWGPNLLSRLASYTLEAQLNPGETMDIGAAVRQPSKITALLFVEYGRFKVLGQPSGLLLCIGITADELEACWHGGSQEVLSKLKENDIFPFTDLQRESVLVGAS